MSYNPATMRHKLHSINVLVLAGFLLVALPLVLALWTTHTRMTELAAATGDAFGRGVLAAREAQVLTGELVQFERNARQYRVVADPTYLELAESRRARVVEALDVLAPVVADRVGDVAMLRRSLAQAIETLRTDTAAIDPSSFERMHAAAAGIADEVNARIDASVAAAQDAVVDAREASLVHASALVPMALLFGVVFAALIVRPLRGLGDAIRQLGRGEFKEPIRIGGASDIEKLGRHLDWLRVELAEVEREKTRFLRHVSHELKTPLANIREGSELLLDGSCGQLSAQQAEIAQILQDNGVSLQKSIENLLNYNAWQQDRTEGPVRRLTDVANMVERVIAAHRLAIQRDGLTVETEIRCPRLWVDGEKVEVMLDNLVSNAIKFSPPGGTIRVTVKGRRRDAVIEVRDDGPGVPAAERHRVFDAFFQGSRPQRGHVKGTGIGLSVVRESARLHGGAAEVVEGEHDGGHFRVTLADARDR